MGALGSDRRIRMGSGCKKSPIVRMSSSCLPRYGLPRSKSCFDVLSAWSTRETMPNAIWCEVKPCVCETIRKFEIAHVESLKIDELPEYELRFCLMYGIFSRSMSERYDFQKSVVTWATFLFHCVS